MSTLWLGLGRRPAALILCSALLGFSAWSQAQTADSASASLGTNLETLVELVRAMSPELSAAALGAEAALARVDGAGTLPDPTFRVEFRDIDRKLGSPIPDRLNRIDYIVEQEFPLWGKRDLARSIAGATANQSFAERQNVELALLASVKTVFSEYFAAHQAGILTDNLKLTLGLLADVAERRYGQGLGSQQDAIMAKIELARLETGLTRRLAEKRRAAARLNALLNRPLSAPLAPPEALPPSPPEVDLDLGTLFARAQGSSPGLKAQDAAISAASGARTLVAKSWYPDVTLGLSAIDQARRLHGYEAMVSIKVPLNWTLRQAEARAAASELGAARSRREAVEAEIRGRLEAAFWSLREAMTVMTILHESHIPQQKLALESALAGYRENRLGLSVVLEAERHVLENELEHLSAAVDQQRYLAEIEKLVGGKL